jgi:hypothetical protein
VLEGVAVPKIPGRGWLRKKPWKWGRHEARLKELLFVGFSGTFHRCLMLQRQQLVHLAHLPESQVDALF